MSYQTNCVLIAGVGGIVPTASRLAGTYAANPSTPMPDVGLLFGLALFFVVGAVLAFAFSEDNLRRAFILGVCAPGIVTNIVGGVSETPSEVALPRFDVSSFISTAYAQPVSSGGVLRISSRVTGPGASSAGNVTLTVIAIREGGAQQRLTAFRANQTGVRVKIPSGTSKLLLRANDFETLLPLRNAASKARVLNLRVNVGAGGKKGFLWALGAKGEGPSVTSIQTSWVGHK